MNLLETKIFAMFILGSVSLLVGLSTIRLRKLLGLKKTETNDTQTKVTSLLLCFGGGVLLATTLLHILPEMRHGMEEAEQSLGVRWLAELVICFGFFLVYLLEEVVHVTLSSTKHTEQLHGTISVRKSVVEKAAEDPESACHPEPASCCKQEGENECHNDMEMNNSKGEVSGYISDERKEGKRQLVTACHMRISPQSDSYFRDFLTVLALCFHSVFEGLAVGLQEDNADVWALFTAISAHKFVIAFCISLELLQAGTKLKVFIIYLVTFSLVTPIGVGLGMVITLLNADSCHHELTVATLNGLAGGTLLYVVMFEVLQREKCKEVSGLLQLLAILLGFGAMTLLEIFVKHEHEEQQNKMLDPTFDSPALFDQEEDLGLFNKTLS